jgi:hypothetical protein
MNCSRCQGLMTRDHFLDIHGQFREMWAASWRCLNCGHVYDAVIEQNRLARPEQVLVHESTEPDYEEDDMYLGGEAFVRRAA